MTIWRGRCLPPRLRTPTAPPPLLSPRKRRAGRARPRRRAPRPLRRKRVSAALTLSAGGRAGTERNLSTEPSRLTGSLWLSPHLDGARSQKSTTSHARVTKETLPPVQLWYQSMGITRRRVCFQWAITATSEMCACLMRCNGKYIKYGAWKKIVKQYFFSQYVLYLHLLLRFRHNYKITRTPFNQGPC